MSFSGQMEATLRVNGQMEATLLKQYILLLNSFSCLRGGGKMLENSNYISSKTNPSNITEFVFYQRYVSGCYLSFPSEDY